MYSPAMCCPRLRHLIPGMADFRDCSQLQCAIARAPGSMSAVQHPARKFFLERTIPQRESYSASHSTIHPPLRRACIHGDEVRASISNTGADAANGVDAAISQHGGPGVMLSGPEADHAALLLMLCGDCLFLIFAPRVAVGRQAHNGSGKTTCFVLSMLSRVDPHIKAAAGELIS